VSEPPNVTQAIPFFGVADMAASLRFYGEGLGFRTVLTWEPQSHIRWCRLELGSAALMLQQFAPTGRPEGAPGLGVSICFQCRDALALYRGFRERGIEPRRPFVGNGLWVVGVVDPDGYRLEFSSPADVAEETAYDEAVHG
jgi:lactoylglutathione lyase